MVKAVPPLCLLVGDEEREASTARHELISPVFGMPVVASSHIGEECESIRSPSEDVSSPLGSNASLAAADERQGSSRNLEEIGKTGWTEKQRLEGEESEADSSPPPVLQGLVLCVVDYPELMEPGTMTKWTEVSRLYSYSPITILFVHV